MFTKVVNNILCLIITIKQNSTFISCVSRVSVSQTLNVGYYSESLEQWFSTGVPRKALGVPPIYELYVYLLLNCSQGCTGCRQIFLKQRKGAANQKRLRPTGLECRINFVCCCRSELFSFKSKGSSKSGILLLGGGVNEFVTL